MLQKFLFVGVGGSGGVTVRVLREQLRARLEDEGYAGGLPAGWQFVHIDVPVQQGQQPEDVALLDNRDYIGLAEPGLKYRHIDEMLRSLGPDALEHTAGWRPDPAKVNVDPTVGGGRFRAIGRVVMGARLAKANERLRKAWTALESDTTNEEFSKVCRELTRSGEINNQPPQVVVVASLAGGSGAAIVGDVCDVLRQIDASTEDRLTAVLYAPEVFQDLSEIDRVGVNPNGLAALCELLNGYWNHRPPTAREFALLSAAGARADADIRRRGPRIMYVIGRSNGEVTFGRQADVFRVVGRGLAVWATSPELQDRFRQYELGNWSDRAQSGPDRSGLVEPQRERPLSSFGCASVGIGIQRYARYSAERLARAVIDHLLLGYWPVQDREKITAEGALEQWAEPAAGRFLQECGLREAEITRAIRDGGAGLARLAQLRGKLLNEVTAAFPSRGLATADVTTRVVNRLGDLREEALAAFAEDFARNAGRWTGQLRGDVAKQAGALIAQHGAPVAVKAVQVAISTLAKTVVSKLKASRDASGQDLHTRVQEALGGTRGLLLAGDPVITKAVDAALDWFHEETERQVYDLAISLVDDLAENLLAPLRDAIGRAREALQVDFDGTSARPSRVQGWPIGDDTVPVRYKPAPNELLLQPTSVYPDLFKRHICAQVGDNAFNDALARARREVTLLIDKRDIEKPVVITDGRWVPRDQRLPRTEQPRPAAFRVHIGAHELLARARLWINQSNSFMGVYLRQSLEEYLAAEGLGEQTRAERLEDFRQKLAQALALSRPLVQINEPVDARLHGPRLTGHRPELTPFPFPPGHPGREVVSQVFDMYTSDELNRLFGTRRRERIDIFSFLDAPVQPLAMASLVGDMQRQWGRDRTRVGADGFWTWRRARQLEWFVPCTPEVRTAMVRGWFAARFLGQIRCENDDVSGEPTEIFVPACAGGYAPFPFPLLGPPIGARDEWLPAILETLALTLIGEPFDAYARLVHLGRTTVVPDHVSRGGELTDWVAEGKVSPGAPEPDPAMSGPAGGTPGERADKLSETLDTWINHYKQYEQRLDECSVLTVSRAWELHRDILDALRTLKQVVDGVKTQKSDSGIG
ncbi:MAG: tubulin-like doman-containing protein [Egibacteraceae bacterium]